MMSKAKIAFFGTPEFSVIILNELKKGGILPELIITAPDKRAGRGLKLTPPPVKVWAEENGIEYLQPEKLDSDFTNSLNANRYTLFLVAAYGKILPKEILELPTHGTLNVHPSLLPKFRGPSPIHSNILENVGMSGVTIMLLDEEMDHGAIVKSQKLKIESEMRAPELEDKLAHLGGKLLAETIPDWISGKIKSVPQDHARATYTKKITKEDGLIDLNDSAELNYRKFRAFYGWPGTYFFVEQGAKKIRVIIKDAELKNGVFKIKRVLPEGKKEMSYKDFLRGI